MTTIEEVGPSKGADLPACLAMNPDNEYASAARRVRLLEAFGRLDAKTRADFLELVEDWSISGYPDPEKLEARRLFDQIYKIAGLE